MALPLMINEETMRAERIIQNALVLLTVAIGVASCVSWLPAGIGTAVPVAATSFIPGESLISGNLTFCHGTSVTLDGTIDSGEYMAFVFDLDVNVERRNVSKNWMGHVEKWGYFPMDETFRRFGDREDAVKREYERLYGTFPQYEEETTILYNGGMTLIADKDFAGVPAGENLAGILKPWRSSYGSIMGKIKEEALLSYPPEWEFTEVFRSRSFSFEIPVGDYKRVDELVTFELTVPVKVVHYLQWLCDSLTEEVPVMQWHDENLTCTFSINKALR